ncbi:hypothetical protein GCM10009827_090640 [Dactylosporangium maewongense]|uniref:Uncharacterized protein n=1 Tax=Dactylosporangium maewongense TaxID=634393 RepID=A0ABP4N5A2_9ACTN
MADRQTRQRAPRRAVMDWQAAACVPTEVTDWQAAACVPMVMMGRRWAPLDVGVGGAVPW